MVFKAPLSCACVPALVYVAKRGQFSSSGVVFNICNDTIHAALVLFI